MPDNLRALYFWRKIVDYLSGGHFTEIFKTEDELITLGHHDPYAMNILSFISTNYNKLS